MTLDSTSQSPTAASPKESVLVEGPEKIHNTEAPLTTLEPDEGDDDPNPASPFTPKLVATCHCAAIHITFPTPQKLLNECLCSICGRYAVLWSYHAPEDVEITYKQSQPGRGELSERGSCEVYAWGDKDIKFHRCGNCGCVTHWTPRDEGRRIVGVNCRMLERGDLEKLGVRKSDGPRGES